MKQEIIAQLDILKDELKNSKEQILNNITEYKKSNLTDFTIKDIKRVKWLGYSKKSLKARKGSCISLGSKSDEESIKNFSNYSEPQELSEKEEDKDLANFIKTIVVSSIHTPILSKEVRDSSGDFVSFDNILNEKDSFYSARNSE